MNIEKVGYWKGMPNRAITLMGLTIRNFFLSRSIILNVLFLLIVPGIALVTVLSPPSEAEDFRWWFNFIEFGNFLYLQIFVLIYCVIYGASLLNSEIEDRTMTFLIIRGSRRFEVLSWKYLALLLSLSLVFILSEILTYFILSLHGPSGSFTDHLPLLFALSISTVLGITVYLAIFSLAGIVFKHPLMISLVYAFLWEIILVNIDYNIGKITMMHYIRSMFGMEETVLEHLEMTHMTGVAESIVVLVVLSLIAMVSGSIVISRKDIH